MLYCMPLLLTLFGGYSCHFGSKVVEDPHMAGVLLFEAGNEGL
jgi:hypothetical protein